MLVGLEILLNLANAVLNLMPIVDMEMTGMLASTLIHLDDSTEQFLDTHATLERGGNDRHTKERGERVEVHMITTTLELIIHIKGSHHAQVHINKLGGEIEVTLKISGIKDVDDHIGQLLSKILSHVKLFG